MFDNGKAESSICFNKNLVHFEECTYTSKGSNTHLKFVKHNQTTDWCIRFRNYHKFWSQSSSLDARLLNLNINPHGDFIPTNPLQGPVELRWT